MPKVSWVNGKRVLVCPLTNKVVPLEKCHECVYYMHRDLSFVFCRVEMDNKFGPGWSIVSKNPMVIRTRSGRTFRFYHPSNGRAGGWYEEAVE